MVSLLAASIKPIIIIFFTLVKTRVGKN